MATEQYPHRNFTTCFNTRTWRDYYAIGQSSTPHIYVANVEYRAMNLSTGYEYDLYCFGNNCNYFKFAANMPIDTPWTNVDPNITQPITESRYNSMRDAGLSGYFDPSRPLLTMPLQNFETRSYNLTCHSNLCICSTGTYANVTIFAPLGQDISDYYPFREK